MISDVTGGRSQASGVLETRAVGRVEGTGGASLSHLSIHRIWCEDKGTEKGSQAERGWVCPSPVVLQQNDAAHRPPSRLPRPSSS